MNSRSLEIRRQCELTPVEDEPANAAHSPGPMRVERRLGTQRPPLSSTPVPLYARRAREPRAPRTARGSRDKHAISCRGSPKLSMTAGIAGSSSPARPAARCRVVSVETILRPPELRQPIHRNILDAYATPSPDAWGQPQVHGAAGPERDADVNVEARRDRRDSVGRDDGGQARHQLIHCQGMADAASRATTER
jgi:hypothetical protein